MKRERGKIEGRIDQLNLFTVIFLYSIYSDELNTINISNRFDVRFIFYFLKSGVFVSVWRFIVLVLLN